MFQKEIPVQIALVLSLWPDIPRSAFLNWELLKKSGSLDQQPSQEHFVPAESDPEHQKIVREECVQPRVPTRPAVDLLPAGEKPVGVAMHPPSRFMNRAHVMRKAEPNAINVLQHAVDVPDREAVPGSVNWSAWNFEARAPWIVVRESRAFRVSLRMNQLCTTGIGKGCVEIRRQNRGAVFLRPIRNGRVTLSMLPFLEHFAKFLLQRPAAVIISEIKLQQVTEFDQ